MWIEGCSNRERGAKKEGGRVSEQGLGARVNMKLG